MKFILKKNHIIITVLAALIAVAGYLNYVDRNADKTVKPVDTDTTDTNDIISNDADVEAEPGQAIIVSGTSEMNFTVTARLSREQLRATNKELLMNIINNENVSDEEREQVVQQLILITETAEKENAAETLLESKGYEGAVVTMTNGNVDVIISKDSLTDVERAQIEDVVKRKTEVEADKITITMMSK